MSSPRAGASSAHSPPATQVILLEANCAFLDLRARQAFTKQLVEMAKNEDGTPIDQLVIMAVFQNESSSAYAAAQKFYEGVCNQIKVTKSPTHCVLDKHLPADTLNEQPSGTYFDRQYAKEERGSGSTPATLPYDQSHLLPVLAQLHYAAKQYPYFIRVSYISAMPPHSPDGLCQFLSQPHCCAIIPDNIQITTFHLTRRAHGEIPLSSFQYESSPSMGRYPSKQADPSIFKNLLKKLVSPTIHFPPYSAPWYDALKNPLPETNLLPLIQKANLSSLMELLYPVTYHIPYFKARIVVSLKEIRQCRERRDYQEELKGFSQSIDAAIEEARKNNSGEDSTLHQLGTVILKAEYDEDINNHVAFIAALDQTKIKIEAVQKRVSKLATQPLSQREDQEAQKKEIEETVAQCMLEVKTLLQKASTERFEDYHDKAYKLYHSIKEGVPVELGITNTGSPAVAADFREDTLHHNEPTPNDTAITGTPLSLFTSPFPDSPIRAKKVSSPVYQEEGRPPQKRAP